MLGQIMILGGVLVLAAVTIPVVVILGMRARSPLAVDVVRRFSRLFRPFQMRTAGRPGAYAAVIRHTGRRSGRTYETPVGAVATDDGFVIALPYGSRAHWVRNVLVSGSAVIVMDGRESQVAQPELIPLESVAARFSPGDQRGHRMFGVRECLRVSRVTAQQAA